MKEYYMFIEWSRKLLYKCFHACMLQSAACEALRHRPDSLSSADWVCVYAISKSADWVYVYTISKTDKKMMTW